MPKVEKNVKGIVRNIDNKKYKSCTSDFDDWKEITKNLIYFEVNFILH